MIFDLTDVALALIGLLSAIATSVVVPWIRAKTTRIQQEQLVTWVKIAVQAAQQLYGQGGGAEKKKYVVNWLEERGIAFDSDAIDAAIESAVYDLW